VYNKELATQILQKLGEAFPKKMQPNELQSSLKDFSGLSEENWLSAIDALLEHGWIRGAALRSGIGDELHDVANMEIREAGQEELGRLRGTAVGNSQTSLLFLSHAASDDEIAKYLKQVIETSVAGLNVFVSSDPEGLPPGDPWVEIILKSPRTFGHLLALAFAAATCCLTSSRYCWASARVWIVPTLARIALS
jgi:hypothetical protein